MTLRHYVCSTRHVRAADVQECHFLYAACRPREWLWVVSKGTDGKPTFRGVLTCHDFARFVIFSEISWTEVRSRWRRSPKICLFGRRPLTGKFSKNVFRKDSWQHRSTTCEQILWNLADRKSAKLCVIYLAKKNKISARSPILASARIVPKICQR